MGTPIPATWICIHFCGTLGMVRTLASLPARLGYLPWMISLWLLLATIRTIFPITNWSGRARGQAGVGVGSDRERRKRVGQDAAAAF